MVLPLTSEMMFLVRSFTIVGTISGLVQEARMFSRISLQINFLTLMFLFEFVSQISCQLDLPKIFKDFKEEIDSCYIVIGLSLLSITSY